MTTKSPIPRGFNYIYFGIYFVLLVLMSASSIFIKEPLSESRFFFFLYAIGQASLETSILIFCGYLFQHLGSRFLFLAYIGATFIFFVLHVLDFLMGRILDLSVWGAISSFVLNETLGNFLFLLDASGIPLWTWILIFSTFGAIPFLGIFLYRQTEKITKIRPLPLKFEYFPLAFFCLPAALFFWDFSGSRIIHPNTYTAFLQSLPWKFTFLQPKNVNIKTINPLAKPPLEAEIEQSIASDIKPLKKTPNIYLFVIESFRADCITKEIAPNLFAFRESNIPIDITLSNGNASHLSWFSIFHSQFSHYWHLLQQKNWKMGSPPLHLLKKLGYQIHLYSSAELGYYGMEELLFGENNFLLDSHQKFHHAPPISASETDAQSLISLKLDLAQNPSLHQGQVFLIFWDSTHFNYSWPKNWTPKFIPFASDLAYFKAFYSKKKIELIMNRYHNSVQYVDHLFGLFLQNLPNQEEAIIIVTGDHGEEFFEHGHLFHGSHIVEEQTRVPIYIKLGTKISQNTRPLASQMDIFPTVIDYLTGSYPAFLQGQSLLQNEKWPYVVISRFNAGRTPFEFCLHNGKNKLIAQFSNRNDILESNSIHVTSMQNASDKKLKDSYKDVPEWINREFGAALDRLFPDKNDR